MADICAGAGPADSGPCTRSAVGTLVMACVHEHVTRNRCCPVCAAEVLATAPDWKCAKCHRAPGAPHQCTPRLVIEWDEAGPVTVVQEASAEVERLRALLGNQVADHREDEDRD